MTRNRLTLVAAGIGLFLLWAAAIYIAIPKSTVYCVEAEFSAAPTDDAELEVWLQTQPGVVGRTATVVRAPTTPPKLVLTFIMQQDTWGRPSFPDVESQADQLGYIIDGKFRDQR